MTKFIVFSLLLLAFAPATIIAATPTNIGGDEVLHLARTTYATASAVNMDVEVAKLLGTNPTDIRIRVYLSTDANFDFSDNLLEHKSYEKVKLDTNGNLPFTFELPADVEQGQYHILVLVQTESGVRVTKTCSTILQVSSEKP